MFDKLKQFFSSLIQINGKDLISRELGRFETVSNNLNKGVTKCREKITKNDTEISKLTKENSENQENIKRANNIINKISELLRAV